MSPGTHVASALLNSEGSLDVGPFTFIATNKLREGKFEAERKRVVGLCDFIKASEPRLFAFNEHADADGAEDGCGGGKSPSARTRSTFALLQSGNGPDRGAYVFPLGSTGPPAWGPSALGDPQPTRTLGVQTQGG
jgi:hypothetical protein